MDVKSYQDAKNLFLSGDLDSNLENFFEQNNFMLEFAYCKLLSGDLETAEKTFGEISSQDLRGDWGKKLIQFINGYISQVPSYFQIRNFLEIDLNLLLQAGKAEYVENIINGSDLFYSINPESYKFIARVMLNNDFTDVALYYLNKAKDKFFYDPEMHLMLAHCYIRRDEKDKAREAIKHCLSILPEYFPAKKIQAMLN